MRRGNRRFYRLLVVNLAALCTLVWAALYRFDVPRHEAAALLVGTLLVVAGTILIAGFFAGIWIALRKWMRWGQGPGSGKQKKTSDPAMRS